MLKILTKYLIIFVVEITFYHIISTLSNFNNGFLQNHFFGKRSKHFTNEVNERKILFCYFVILVLITQYIERTFIFENLLIDAMKISIRQNPGD